MTKIGLNHRDTIAEPLRPLTRRLYVDVLGARLESPRPDVDIFSFADGSAIGAYYVASDVALTRAQFQRALWLEFEVGDVEMATAALAAIDIHPFEYHDKRHSYFQSPGGMCFRLAARREHPHAISDNDTVLAAADIAMPPDVVLRALTTVEQEVWWGAPGVYRMTKWRSDFRVGGSWDVVTVPASGGEHPAHGTWLAIASDRISLTRCYDFDFPYGLGRRETMVFYQVAPIRNGTHLVVRHDGFAGTAAASEHAAGWERVLRWLAVYADKGAWRAG